MSGIIRFDARQKNRHYERLYTVCLIQFKNSPHCFKARASAVWPSIIPTSSPPSIPTSAPAANISRSSNAANLPHVTSRRVLSSDSLPDPSVPAALKAVTFPPRPNESLRLTPCSNYGREAAGNEERSCVVDVPCAVAACVQRADYVCPTFHTHMRKGTRIGAQT